MDRGELNWFQIERYAPMHEFRVRDWREQLEKRFMLRLRIEQMRNDQGADKELASEAKALLKELMDDPLAPRRAGRPIRWQATVSSPKRPQLKAFLEYVDPADDDTVIPPPALLATPDNRPSAMGASEGMQVPCVVDLAAPNSVIKRDFKEWLKGAKRDYALISSSDRVNDRIALYGSWRLLPYFDIWAWRMTERGGALIKDLHLGQLGEKAATLKGASPYELLLFEQTDESNLPEMENWLDNIETKMLELISWQHIDMLDYWIERQARKQKPASN